MDRTRWILTSLALVPCVASAISCCAPAAPAAVAPAPPRPALSFSQYSVTLPKREAIGSVSSPYHFQNSSSETVKITSVKPSCGCVSAVMVRKKNTYGPGERGELHVSLPTANEAPGRHEYTITVAYNDGQERKVDLKFNVDLPQKSVRLEPKELYFYQHGEKLTKTAHIVDERGKLLNILDAKVVYYNGEDRPGEDCPTEIAEATILPSEFAADGQRRIPIQIDVSGDTPPKQSISHVVITTSDPDFKTLKLPVLIQRQKTAAPAPVQQSSVPRLYNN